MSEVNISSQTNPEGELILGKFTSTDELAAAYKQLESKLGSNYAQTPEEASVPSEGTKTPEVVQEPSEGLTGAYGEAVVSAVSAAGLDITKVSEEFYSESGLTEATRTALDGAFGKSVVDAYFAGLSAQNAEATQQVNQGLQSVVDAVGGEESWNTIATWAGGANGDAELADAFNAAIDRGDTVTMRALAQTLKAGYERANGTLSASSVTTGVAGGSGSTAGFRSQAELTAAMRSKEYQTDPAYRQEVAQRLANTKGFSFNG